MAKAEILKNGRVVRSDNFTNEVRHDLDGFLVEFSVENITYLFRQRNQFKIADLNTQGRLISDGYYQKSKIIEYYGNDADVDIVNNSKLEKEARIKEGVKGDEIKIQKLVVDASNKEVCSVGTYKFTYDGNRLNVLDGNFNIRIPNGTEQIIKEVENLHPEAVKFLKNRIALSNQFSTVESEHAALLINKIALVISMINKDIFPLFSAPGADDFSTYVNAQNLEWKVGDVFNPLTIKSLGDLLNGLRQYFQVAFFDQKLISKSKGIDKLYWLANILSPKSLRSIPLPQRISVLEILALKSGLSDNLEEFALRIVNSIDLVNQNEVNEFLGALIGKKYAIDSRTETLYSLLYRNIENYRAPLKAVLELVGNKEFSKDNRTRFVNAILLLWTESKYNPYKNLQPNGDPDYSLIDNSTYDYDKDLNHFSVINYVSEKNAFGVYNDRFTFEFDPWGRGIYWITENKDYSLTASSPLNLYQPVTLVTYPSETDTSIQLPKKDSEFNGVIPLFYLAYIDKDGDDKDFNTKVGILVDVVTTISGIGNITKLRHLRHLSKLGKVLYVLGVIQISASVLNFLLRYSSDCDGSTFCKKLQTLLFFIELTALVTDPIAAAKAKKAAQELIEDGIEHGWPSGMLDEIEGATPKRKIEELAEMGSVEYLNRYVSEGKEDLIRIVNEENQFRRSVNKPIGMVIYYKNPQIEEVLTYAASKGLSKEDGMGVLHQACRKRDIEYIASIEVLKGRMDNLVNVRKRGYPFTFQDKLSFDNYAELEIGPVLDKFGFNKDRIYFTGSSITNKSSISGGTFDTDWAIRYSKKELEEFADEMERRFRQAAKDEIITEGYSNKNIKAMKDFLKKKGELHKRYIVTIEDGKLANFEKVMQNSSSFSVKTDMTTVVDGLNVGYPRVKYKFK
ncbi:hypothetical protein [Pedobacter steynii]|uniref:Uncharacterized protein n=1 Tax=Pedobacter steynii TaxID=430522 RepID=A0A1D7QBC3_9SPHI|nr:hypothetical protein [Pedobacter steynii]AOM75998.1 hypothetical protein BFS30_01755 [Pedobacter steynii]